MLHTGVDIEVGTASYRSVRGYTLIGAVLDEVAFWMFEPDSLNADTEVVAEAAAKSRAAALAPTPVRGGSRHQRHIGDGRDETRWRHPQ